MEASHNNTVKVSVEPHGRPCWVTHRSAGSVTKHKAFLHLITTRAFVVEPSPLIDGHPGGQISRPFAVIENEFGCLVEVELESVQLLDTDEQLEENAAAWEVQDPHQPLKRREGETSEAFVERVQTSLHHGKLTANAARKSLGIPPVDDLLKERKDCATCQHAGLSGRCGPCQDCLGFDKWEPRA